VRHDDAQPGERAETYLRLLAEAALRPGQEPACDIGVHRVRRAAEVLIEASVLDEGRASEVLLSLSMALRGRHRATDLSPELVFSQGPLRRMVARTLPRTTAAKAGPSRVIPAPPAQPSGSRLMALVVTADRMIAPATLRFPSSAGLLDLAGPSFGDLTATDDVGTGYMVSFTNGAWAGSTWTGTIMIRPAPPRAARLLTINSPNDRVLLVPLSPPEEAPPARAHHDQPSGAILGYTVAAIPDSPGERLLTRVAEALLGTLSPGPQDGSRAYFVPAGHTPRPPGPIAYSMSGTTVPGGGFRLGQDLAEMISTLEGAGALSPLSPMATQVAALDHALSHRRGDPAVSSRGGDPAADPARHPRVPGIPGWGPSWPARWTTMLAYYGRRTHPPLASGTGAIGALLPEVDGARFVVAGVRTTRQGTVLHVVAWNLPQPPPALAGHLRDAGYSWWVQDDADGWHLGTVLACHVANESAALRYSLTPPLKPAEQGATGSLTVEVTGSRTRLTARLRVSW